MQIETVCTMAFFLCPNFGPPTEESAVVTSTERSQQTIQAPAGPDLPLEQSAVELGFIPLTDCEIGRAHV